MKPGRVLVGLLAAAAVATVSLVASNVQSNFVPGDFGPAAEKLGIEMENGYYDLGQILDAIAQRLRDPVGILDQTRAISPGLSAFLVVRTVPMALCEITITYASGESTAQKLDPRRATADGIAAWSWVVGSATRAGTAMVTVTCSSPAGSATYDAEFEVTG